MRRGVLMVEVLVGCALTGVLLALCVQLLSVSALERRDVERRAIALEQAANLIERVATMSFDQVTAEALNQFKLPAEAEAILPGAAAKWFVADEPGEVPAKHVRVEIAWQGVGGRQQVPARLSYWVYGEPPGAAP